MDLVVVLKLFTKWVARAWTAKLSISCFEYPSSYVDQAGRQFAKPIKVYKGVVRRQDENPLLALHCLTAGHAFDWDRDTVVKNTTSKHKREFVEAWNTTSTYINECINLDAGYKTLREY